VTRVALVGLGKQGTLLVERLRSRPDAEIVAVIEADRAKVGRSLDEVLGTATGIDLTVHASLDRLVGADVALLTTSSWIADAAPLIEQIAAKGVNVITTAEELGYPWRQYPELSAQLDATARKHGVSIVGAGANPGFLMDLLPIVLSHASEEISGIVVRRSADMRPHRPERLTRFGLGRTRQEFAEAGAEIIHGHVGFTQSIHCLADALGWELDEVREYDPEPAVVAAAPRAGAHFVVEEGTVAVVNHRAVGILGEQTVIDLSMYLGFPDPGDDVPHTDRWQIKSCDEVRTVDVQPPWTPFGATPSTVVNLLAAAVAGPPGLLCSADFPARALAARGNGRR
jgi:hypothetical protein